MPYFNQTINLLILVEVYVTIGLYKKINFKMLYYKYCFYLNGIGSALSKNNEIIFTKA